MKTSIMRNLINVVISLVIIVSQGCSKKDESFQYFSSTSDTLIIKMQTIKGQGLFPWQASAEYFRDIDSNFTYPIIIPDNLKKVKRAQRFIDIRAWRYNEFKLSNEEKLPNYILDDVLDNKLDTSNFVRPDKNCIDILTGILEGKRVYIVDENNNKDLKDDSVRYFQQINQDSMENVVKCNFNIYNGYEITEDSTWIIMEQFDDYSGFWFCVYEHLIADILIDGEYYKIGIIDEQSGFPYQYPILALLATNNSSKDSLLLKDILYRDEFIKLNNDYYRFDNVSNNGDYLTLIKERNFESKVGSQIGMIAPEFNCISTAGDTIVSSNLHDKFLVIANLCDCGGDTITSLEYAKMVKEYGDSVHILGLDSQIRDDLDGILVNTQNKANKTIYSNYRKVYCSRVCYVIDKNNRIIDKFPTWNWANYLPKYLSISE